MRKENKVIKDEKGITLIALVITIVIILMLVLTVTNHMGELKTAKNYTDFEKDMNRLKEAVISYYASNQTLPIRNIYTNISMIQGIKNPNDGTDYYVLDLDKLNMDLKILEYGKVGYDKVKQFPVNYDITTKDSITDLYIINEDTHTIYYPEGVEIMEKKQYRLLEKDVVLER